MIRCKRTYLYLAAAVLFSACAEDEPLQVMPSGRAIGFEAGAPGQSRAAERTEPVWESFTLADEDDADNLLYCTAERSDFAPCTRAAAVGDAAEVNRIGLLAYADWFSGLLMDNDLYERSGSGIFHSSAVRYWTDDAEKKVDFYAYAPYAPRGLVLPDSKASTTLAYTVPADAAEQCDLMLAARKGLAGNYNQTVDLSFRHLLAGVKVVFPYLPAGASVQSVSFSGLRSSATLDMSAETPAWTLADQTADFTASPGDGGELTFMMLPQRAANVTLSVTLQTASGTVTHSRTLESLEWQMGKITTYRISVIDFTLDITNVPETQDAHYVICSAEVEAANLPAGRQQWTLTASASDGADVTIAAELNGYQKNGFWTDRILFQADGTTTLEDRGSARGASSLTAEGSRTVYLFLPENTGDEDRTVTLTLEIVGIDGGKSVKTFVQRCPDWSGSFGWEQDESDNPAATWGFLWERKVTYRKHNYYWNWLIYGPMAEDLRTQYNATGYAKVSNTRMFQYTTIAIDYSSLNDLSGRNLSESDGLQNTQELYRFSGGASTGNFEQAIKNLASRGENGVFDVISESGENNMTSAALGYILRKNRYNLVQIEKKDGSDVVVSESPVINVNDIVWYLPARTQFADAPAETPLSGEYWSSTPDGNETAFTNTGSRGRMETWKIRACRQHP